MTQKDLFGNPVVFGGQSFDGETIDPEIDPPRLHGQMARVTKVLLRSGWWSLYEIGRETGDPVQSISARIRDLRKAKFGGHEVDHRRRTDGTWEYRLRLRRAIEFREKK